MKAGTKFSLVLGSHAHVPYGAGANEFERVYTNLLKPFVSTLYKFPRIQAALHYSGVLLHWVERSHPELFMLIEDMVTRKQIEMLGGGFYEPALPVIPLQDKIGQTELLTTYLRKQFGKRPLGCWIPSFAWEQNLVSPLASCGMGYTFLGEQQFNLADSKTPPYYPCICEDQGKLITVFPVLQSLESGLEKKSVSAVLEDFSNRLPKNSDTVVSVFPDKPFPPKDDKSESPDFIWNYFFDELSKCESFVETACPGKIVKNLKNLKKIFFPDSGCSGTDTPRRFIVGNAEANGIYSKMIFTNLLINQLRGDKSRKLSAREEFWKAQGISLFSFTGERGLHNINFRNAAYTALLEAEKITREKGKFIPSLVPFDINLDGSVEWLFQDSKLNCYVQTIGGGIFELDYMPKAWNYLGTCNGRLAFADRLLPADTNPENTDADGKIPGARFCFNERYELNDLDKVRRKLRLSLHQSPALPFGNIELEKTFSIKKDSVLVNYSFANRGEPVKFIFAPGIDLSLPGEGDTFSRFFLCKSETQDMPLAKAFFNNADGIKIHDMKNEVQITLAVNKPFNGSVSPVYVSDSITGEKLYQAVCVFPFFTLSLEKNESWEADFTLKFTH